MFKSLKNDLPNRHARLKNANEKFRAALDPTLANPIAGLKSGVCNNKNSSNNNFMQLKKNILKHRTDLFIMVFLTFFIKWLFRIDAFTCQSHTLSSDSFFVINIVWHSIQCNKIPLQDY